MRIPRSLWLSGWLLLLSFSTVPASDFVNPISDHGVYGDRTRDLPSYEYPTGGQKYYLWEGRFWAGAKIGAQYRVSQADPSGYEWTPTGGGTPVFTLVGDDLLEHTVTFNDLGTVPGHTPIGLQVSQTVTAWDGPTDPLGAHMVEMTIQNASGSALDSVYFAWVFDFDVCSGPNGDSNGAAVDDLCGWSGPNWLAYMFDGDNPGEAGDDTGDNGISPGYAGLAWIDGAVEPCSFQYWTSATDPDTDTERFQYMAGMPPGGGAPFATPPTVPQDYRILLSVGPYSMAAGTSVTTIICYAIGDGPAGLNQATNEMIDFYNRPVTFEMFPQVTVIPPAGGNLVYGLSLNSELNMTIPGLAFWTQMQFPNGQEFSPVTMIPFTHSPFMNVSLTNLTQAVPGYAPPGIYHFFGHVGFFPNPVLSDVIEWEKQE